jgi:hypothetical protein
MELDKSVLWGINPVYQCMIPSSTLYILLTYAIKSIGGKCIASEARADIGTSCISAVLLTKMTTLRTLLDL